MNKICIVCGNEFVSLAHNQRYCSHSCQEQGRKSKARKNREHRKHPCLDCGKSVDPSATRCLSCCRKGSLHHLWKGGRVGHQGYILVLNPQHPRANKRGYVAEHLLVWELSNGKPLPADWVIHHLNGIKSDNRPANLVGLPTKKHYLVLQAKAKRIQELESQLIRQSLML